MTKITFRPVEIPELGMDEIVNLFPSIGNLIWQVMRAFPAFVGQETGGRRQRTERSLRSLCSLWISSQLARVF
jgi:hypothetical protein